MRSNLSGLALVLFLLLTLPMAAQDTPIGTPGIQVATEETPGRSGKYRCIKKRGAESHRESD
jgi:hypothetical protein